MPDLAQIALPPMAAGTSLLVQVKDKKSKKKKHDQDSGLTDCTIESAGGGGCCKTGFKRVREKLKSGKDCCGCVVDKSSTAELL